jgi:hypothetical protein
MAIFFPCRKCGCKAVVVPVIGALLLTAVHHQDLCWAQPDGQALSCAKYVAEPVHTHEHETSKQPIRSVTVTSSFSGTSPVYSLWDVQ